MVSEIAQIVGSGNHSTWQLGALHARLITSSLAVVDCELTEVVPFGASQLRMPLHETDVFVFRGRAGSLIKALWHDGIGLSLYAKRLDRGRFVWPATVDGVVALSSAQMSYLLEAIDWRNPQHTWRPQSAG
jgi:hypothetical protein